MIMGKYSLLFFIVCFLFFIPGFSSAQVKITLDSCIARALESNYSIKIIRNQQRQAENNLNYGPFLPTIGIDVPRNNRLPIVKWSPTEKTEGPIIPVRML